MRQIDQKTLKENLSYDERSGLFTWIRQTVGRPKAGSVAGTVRPDGYVTIRINGKIYLAHRLAWCYVYGEMPISILDHINMNRSDNRIDNLRMSNNRYNAYNTGANKNNKSGYPGVCFIGERPRSKKSWQANICVNGKRKTIGKYETAEMAFEAYLNAKKKFHCGIGVEHINRAVNGIS